jgi:hypothetical protein
MEVNLQVSKRVSCGRRSCKRIEVGRNSSRSRRYTINVLPGTPCLIDAVARCLTNLIQVYNNKLHQPIPPQQHHPRSIFSPGVSTQDTQATSTSPSPPATSPQPTSTPYPPSNKTWSTTPHSQP